MPTTRTPTHWTPATMLRRRSRSPRATDPTVTLSITGSDDVSVITGDTSGAATEAATDVTVTGAADNADTDALDAGDN